MRGGTLGVILADLTASKVMRPLVRLALLFGRQAHYECSNAVFHSFIMNQRVPDDNVIGVNVSLT